MPTTEQDKLLQRARTNRETAARARDFARNTTTRHVVDEFRDLATKLELEAELLEEQAHALKH